MKYRIGSFNMCYFGEDSKKNLQTITKIICGEKYDIVAMQEIFSEGKGVHKLFNKDLDFQLSEYDYSDFGFPSKDPKDPYKIQEIKNKRGEGYIFLWKKNKFRLSEYIDYRGRRIFEPRIVNSKGADARGVDCGKFVRAPYYIRLQPLNGGFFEFRLISIHVYFGDEKTESINKRNMEYDILTKEIYPKIAGLTYGVNRTAYTIAMGDYNLNLFNPLVQDKNCWISELYSYQEGRKNIEILTIQDGLTTLRKPASISKDDWSVSKYANNFDHFTYSPQLSSFANVSYEVVDAVNKYCDGNHQEYYENISDHLPITMDVEISNHVNLLPVDVNRIRQDNNL